MRTTGRSIERLSASTDVEDPEPASAGITGEEVRSEGR
jgi:hypothetical protein